MVSSEEGEYYEGTGEGDYYEEGGGEDYYVNIEEC